MTKPINEYTADELSAKIEAIKAERERTANALKKYEEELERRKQEGPLGVPLEYPIGDAISRAFLLCFQSKESADKFDNEYFTNFIKALQDIAKGEPIDIKVLLPLLKKGWVAMDKNNRWCWYMEKPYIEKFYFCWNTGSPAACIGGFNIKPAENWETSLMECGI